MKSIRLVYLFSIAAFQLFAQNQRPVLTNLSGQINATNQTFELKFDVADAENDSLELLLELSNDSGASYALSNLPQSGDVGFPIFSKTGGSVVVDLSSLPQPLPQNLTARLTVLDHQPLDIQSLVNQVDSNRLRQALKFVEGKRHRTTGAVHLEAVRDSLRKFYANQCFLLKNQSFAFGSYQGKNIIGKHFGYKNPTKTYLVGAHYDTVGSAPGADDNGSGTVGVLEAARVLGPLPCKKSLYFGSFDLEESGLLGSAAYNGQATGIEANEEILGAFVFEMIGYYSEKTNSQTVPTGFDLLFPAAFAQLSADQFRGNFITNVSNDTSKTLAASFNLSAQQYVPALKVSPVPIPGNWQSSFYQDLLRSDHASFWLKNRPALMLTDGANFRNPCYHLACDTANGKLNFTFMSRVVAATVGALATLVEAQHGSWATINCPLSPVVSTNFVEKMENWLIFPNPTSHEIFLKFNDKLAKQVDFELLDLNGKTVRSARFVAPFSEVEKLSIADLPSGEYVVRLRDGLNERSEKIVVQQN